jgi:6-phosphogluconolactonase
VSGAGEVIVARDEEEHATLAAELVARAIQDAVDARGVARIALSGGSTPELAYRKVAALALPWERTEWFWVDERAVPPDADRSNYKHATRDLGLAARVPPGRIHRMEADAPDLDAAARGYERALREAFGVAAAVAFDVVTLGVGDDGHTASLFPGMPTVRVRDRLVAAVPAQPDKGLEPRLTLTAPVLEEAKLAIVLCRGAKKQPVVAAARAPGSLDQVPSRLTQSIRGRVVWLLDADAAGA